MSLSEYCRLSAKSTGQPTYKRTNKQTNERTNERTNKRTNEQTNERTNERTNEQASKQASKQTNERTNERTNEQTYLPTPHEQHTSDGAETAAGVGGQSEQHNRRAHAARANERLMCRAQQARRAQRGPIERIRTCAMLERRYGVYISVGGPSIRVRCLTESNDSERMAITMLNITSPTNST